MEWTKHIRPTDLQQLIINWEEQLPLKATTGERDYQPVVKIFNPVGAATFLISECDNEGLAFGLSDLGFGEPELGYISMDEIFSVQLPGGLTMEQDIYFKPTKTLSEYASEARHKGRIMA
ncbi:DUF2958 domain-containing protein [Sphingobium sp. WTD-1]|uniref:DUF2958 domain-containing protein n=1 Tax=Sphingobium sp. WTD-1 TaxID=2979467 RepID=UPI0024DE6BCD|nr:DUF2958 domain-containing protein [Sphingobium sp. WTD-1]WIA55993.1 DUF2958 domain-containing protein [Sphingobium sp. WTD-1]